MTVGSRVRPAVSNPRDDSPPTQEDAVAGSSYAENYQPKTLRGSDKELMEITERPSFLE
jgi:hypothetical protein